MGRWQKVADEEKVWQTALGQYQGAKGVGAARQKETAAATVDAVMKRSAWLTVRRDPATRAAHRDRMQSSLVELERLEGLAAKSSNPMLFERIAFLEDEAAMWETRIRRSERLEDIEDYEGAE